MCNSSFRSGGSHEVCNRKNSDLSDRCPGNRSDLLYRPCLSGSRRIYLSLSPLRCPDRKASSARLQCTPAGQSVCRHCHSSRDRRSYLCRLRQNQRLSFLLHPNRSKTCLDRYVRCLAFRRCRMEYPRPSPCQQLHAHQLDNERK